MISRRPWVFAAFVLACTLAASGQDAPAPASSSAADAALPQDAEPPPLPQDDANLPAATYTPAETPPQNLYRASIKPSDDSSPGTPPPAPLPITPSARDYISPFQMVRTGSVAESILLGNGIHGGVGAGVTYDDNVFLGNGRNTPRVGVVSYSINPFLTIKRGGEDAFGQGSLNSVALTYNGGLSFYQARHISPEYSSDLNLNAQVILNKVNLGFSEVTNVFSDALLGTSTRTQYRFFTTDLSARIPWTDKTVSNHNLTFSVADYQTGYSSYDLSSRNSVSHPVTEKLQAGAGFTAGLNLIQDTPAQPYQQAFLLADYTNLRKLHAELTIGGQLTELVGGRNFGLVYSGQVSDNPFDGTTVQLHVYRNTNSSSDVFPAGLNNPVRGRFNADYTSTGVELQVTQRLVSRLTLTGVTGFDNSEYFSATTGSSLNQHFDYFYLGVSLSLPVTRYGSVRAGYNYRQNTGRTLSNTFPPSEFNFDDNSFSASLQVQF